LADFENDDWKEMKYMIRKQGVSQ